MKNTRGIMTMSDLKDDKKFLRAVLKMLKDLRKKLPKLCTDEMIDEYVSKAEWNLKAGHNLDDSLKMITCFYDGLLKAYDKRRKMKVVLEFDFISEDNEEPNPVKTIKKVVDGFTTGIKITGIRRA